MLTLPIATKAELTSLSTILDIPIGTVFELTRELDVKANRDYQILGRDSLLESFNEVHQIGNEYAGRNHRTYHYDSYIVQWRKSIGKTYQDCLDRHRVYYYSDDNHGGNSTIISQGNNNANVIVNSSPDVISGSYQGPHNCLQPQHAVALLLIKEHESEAGGAFKEGYQFTVKKVQHRQNNTFHTVTLYFDHPVAEGIRIVSTQHPEEIFAYQLQQQSTGNGFWESIGNALTSVQHIGGQLFDIKQPGKWYYE